jgi:hypothetical protein
MIRRVAVFRWAPVALAALTLLASLFWWESRWFDYWPVDDAAHEARWQTQARGYRMGGYLGDFLQQPDGIGGCAVRIEFYDLSDAPPKRKVTVKLRRAWRLGGWSVTEMKAEEETAAIP